MAGRVRLAASRWQALDVDGLHALMRGRGDLLELKLAVALLFPGPELSRQRR